ncbi:TonB-dependent receptor [Gallaecimonas mangrovi]|uniref:TonB-dependent receptor n=1 Tax=Gallaecimonas mangrovi TaxID=2291597 RepID=UPI0018673DB7|nr:TonB-dependent receptor [Gallaecimonas mangrovi]
MFKRSMLSASIALILASHALPSWAADKDTSTKSQTAQKGKKAAKNANKRQATDDTEVIEVHGVRESMSRALELKKDNVQLVDSIVSEDIGKLPDNNVVEALQHVAGVQVGTRSEGESSSVLIRGLGNVVTTINGRDAFTAASRSFSLADIPATMLAGVDVYKTASADMVEGGIGGVINVRTHRPFDFQGKKFSFTGKGTYSDQSKYYDPNFSMLMSDRWSNDTLGDFGALLNLSYVRTHYRDETIWNGAVFPYSSDGTALSYTAGEALSTTDDSYSLLRDSIGAVDTYGVRDRPSADLSLQWAPNDSASYYLDAFYTGYNNRGNASYFYTRTDATPTADYDYFPGTNVVSHAQTEDPFILTSSQASENHTDNYQLALGGKWVINEKLDFASEVDYQLSKYVAYSEILDLYQTGDSSDVYFNDGSGTPSITFGSGTDLTSYDNVYTGTYFDGRSKSRGTAKTWRGDFTYYQPLGIVESWKFGARYDIHDAISDAYQVSSADEAWQIQADTIPGLLTLTPGGFTSGDNGSFPSQWVTADPDFLLDNTGLLRSTLTSYTGEPDWDPTQHFDINEKTAALYGQANLYTDIGSHSLDGVLGLRVVQTRSDLNGYEVEDDSDGNSVATPSNIKNTDTNLLPNLQLRFKYTDDLQLRFNASKTITRPAFSDLNPALTLTDPIEGEVPTGSGSGGNANLKPMESVNFDLGVGYYFGQGSAAYATLFHRNVDDWIVTTTTNQTINDITYSVTRPENAGKSRMQGLELGLQYFPEHLPGWLQGFGIQTSYTYIDAYTRSADTGEKDDMTNVSKNSASAVLVYERGDFSARVSQTWRSKYLVGTNATGSMPIDIIAKPQAFTDMSMSYKVTDGLTVTLDATNIFGNGYKDYFEDDTLYNRDTRSYSTTYSLGFRYSM